MATLTLANVHEAVQKLVAFLKSGQDARQPEGDVNMLFTSSSEEKQASVEIEVAFITSPVAHRVPLYFVVPHEIMLGTICLITNPPQDSYERKVLALAEDSDPIAQRVKRIMDTKNLNAKINDPVSVRAFSKSYDNFILYDVKKFPKQLTGEFLGHQRLPVWIAKSANLSEALTTASKTVVVPRRGANAAVCRVGHTGLSVSQLEENITVFIDSLVQSPRGCRAADILHIRVAGTNAAGKRAGLPIFGHPFELVASEKEAHPSKKSKIEN
ncbi:hypothetical protein STCU_01314 [Strigomonas culicis]|uniref:Ribosomal protein L1 n=1 Tax=Strigomonas culicis TaxID=28005 RepID=S9V1A3_9TRYP|nr:hypothetical protein STCU_01314 [Strigomonas culicis]|eukprot:EPY34788.1 hypothetical protein STCU_01314 [Strigomonas culicis]